MKVGCEDSILVFTNDIIALIFLVSQKMKNKYLSHKHALNMYVYRRLFVVFRSVSLSFQSIPMTVLPGDTEADYVFSYLTE